MSTSLHSIAARESNCQNIAAKSTKDGPNSSDIDILFFNFLELCRSFLKTIWSYSAVLLLAVILVVVLYVLYKSYVNPDLYVKYASEIGFDHLQGRSRAAQIARVQRAKRLDPKTPPPYPNGWFAVAESSELKPGAVMSVDALGQNFCLYRGEDYVARCVDAYCPHLGANLGVGGSVSGDCIQCPFHHWQFAGDGCLVGVPGLETVPKGISIKTWCTTEADGAIWVWHDAEGREPLWSIQDADELKSWSYRGRNDFTVNCHIQEIPENGADSAHLNVVHSPSLLSKMGDKFPMLYGFIGAHQWEAVWTKSEDHDHMAAMTLTHDYRLLKLNLFHIDVDVTQIGPGHVRLRMSTPFGPVLISQSVTPLGPLEQKVVHRIFSPTYNAPLCLFLNRGESYMFERDMAIWNSKTFISSPLYTRHDKSIRAFRAWYSQFYSENSVSFRDALRTATGVLDW